MSPSVSFLRKRKVFIFPNCGALETNPSTSANHSELKYQVVLFNTQNPEVRYTEKFTPKRGEFSQMEHTCVSRPLRTWSHSRTSLPVSGSTRQPCSCGTGNYRAVGISLCLLHSLKNLPSRPYPSTAAGHWVLSSVGLLRTGFLGLSAADRSGIAGSWGRCWLSLSGYVVDAQFSRVHDINSHPLPQCVRVPLRPTVSNFPNLVEIQCIWGKTDS